MWRRKFIVGDDKHSLVLDNFVDKNSLNVYKNIILWKM